MLSELYLVPTGLRLLAVIFLEIFCPYRDKKESRFER